MSYQLTTIFGNVGRINELRYTPSGKAVLNFSVAVNKTSNDNPTWFEVTVWNGLAESLAKNLTTGKSVFCVGEVSVNAWVDNNTGKARASLKLNASTFRYAGSAMGASTDADEIPV